MLLDLGFPARAHLFSFSWVQCPPPFDISPSSSSLPCWLLLPLSFFPGFYSCNFLSQEFFYFKPRVSCSPVRSSTSLENLVLEVLLASLFWYFCWCFRSPFLLFWFLWILLLSICQVRSLCFSGQSFKIPLLFPPTQRLFFPPFPPPVGQILPCLFTWL